MAIRDLFRRLRRKNVQRTGRADPLRLSRTRRLFLEQLEERALLTIDLAAATWGAWDHAIIPASQRDTTISELGVDGEAGFTIVESDGGTSVSESGAADTFTVVLDVQPNSNVVLTVSSGDPGEATAGPANLTFTPGNWDVVQTVTVTGIDDHLIDGSQANWNVPQTVTVTGTDDDVIDGGQLTAVTVSVSDGVSDDNFDPLADQAVSVTTLDNDAAGFTIVESGGATSVSENGTTDAFTVVLNAQPNTDVVLSVSSGDLGEAAAGPAALTFTAGNWNVEQTVTVTGVNDTLIDGSQTTAVTISVNDGASDDNFDPLPGRVVAGTTLDNDTATVSFTLATGTCGENAGGTTLVASLTTAADHTLENAATFSVSTTLGNTETTDFSKNVASITFAAGSGNGALPTTELIVTPAADALVEGDETVTFTLAPTSGLATAGSTATHALTIIDADTATVSFLSAAGTLSETTDNDLLRVKLTTSPAGNTLENAARFNVTTTRGSAEPADFTVATLIFFRRGEGNGEMRSLVFQPFHDSLVEGTETLTFTLSVNSGEAAVGTFPSHEMSIQDADAATVSFVLPASSRGENSGGADRVVKLTTAAGNTLENAAVFNVNTSLITAEAADFTPVATSITFLAGSGNGYTMNLNVAPLPDMLVEGTETVSFTLSVASGAATVGGTPSHVQVISDADTAIVAFAPASSTRGEDAGAAGLAATLTTAAGNTLEAAAVFNVGTTLGTAEAADFIPVATSITFAANSGNGAVMNLSFTPNPDTLVEGTETVSFLLSVASGAAGVGNTASHHVLIADADAATVSFTHSAIARGEDAGLRTVAATLTTAAGNTLENTAVFSISTSLGNTEGSDDFTKNLASIRFAVGSGNGAAPMTDLKVTPKPDTLVEGDEAVTFRLTRASGAATVGSTPTNAFTITDADTATVSFAPSAVTRGENAGLRTVAATLTTAEGNTLENTALFSISTSLGNTEGTDDFTKNLASISFAVGSGNGAAPTTDLKVTPKFDLLVEGDETVTFTLARTSGAATVGSTPTNAFTIIDADTASVSFQSPTGALTEDGGSQNVTLVLSMTDGNTLENAVVFSVAAVNGTAENEDYDQAAFPKTVTFTAGQKNGDLQQLPFVPAGDALLEGDETVTLTVSATGGAATVGARNTHVVTILDADGGLGGITLFAANANLAEVAQLRDRTCGFPGGFAIPGGQVFTTKADRGSAHPG